MYIIDIFNLYINKRGNSTTVGNERFEKLFTPSQSSKKEKIFQDDDVVFLQLINKTTNFRW